MGSFAAPIQQLAAVGASRPAAAGSAALRAAPARACRLLQRLAARRSYCCRPAVARIRTYLSHPVEAPEAVKMAATQSAEPNSPFAEDEQQRGVTFAPDTADNKESNISPSKSFKLVASPRCGRRSLQRSATGLQPPDGLNCFVSGPCIRLDGRAPVQPSPARCGPQR